MMYFVSSILVRACAIYAISKFPHTVMVFTIILTICQILSYSIPLSVAWKAAIHAAVASVAIGLVLLSFTNFEAFGLSLVESKKITAAGIALAASIGIIDALASYSIYRVISRLRSIWSK